MMEKKWFVVYTRPQQEIKTSEQLNAMASQTIVLQLQ